MVAAIDERTYERLGISSLEPIPRKYHATAIETLRKYGAKMVFFDMVFKNEGKDKEADLAFAQALQTMPTAIAWYFKYYE